MLNLFLCNFFVFNCLHGIYPTNSTPLTKLYQLANMLNILFLNRDFAEALCSVLVMIKDFLSCIAFFVCNLVLHNVNLDGTEFFIGKRKWQEMLHAVCQGPLHCREWHSNLLDMGFSTWFQVSLSSSLFGFCIIYFTSTLRCIHHFHLGLYNRIRNWYIG